MSEARTEAPEERGPTTIHERLAHRRIQLPLLALVTIVPVLFQNRGRVVADTKQYLYEQPSRLLTEAAFIWDPDVALGTVTHQLIGYLWPMGPWFWLNDQLGVPVWVAQRLWLGLILFIAGAGILRLARVEGWDGAGAFVAALVYVWAPYTLPYATRGSVLLLSWALLPWMVASTIQAVRHGGWRHPAAVALLALTAGSVNLSSLVFVSLAVIAVFPFAVFVHGEATLREAFAAMIRVGVATAAVSAWSFIALVVEGGYGSDILGFSESLQGVASASTPTEVWRGLGFWIGYGTDRLAPWVEGFEPYTQSTWLIVAGFALAAVLLGAALVVRWRRRAYYLTLIVVGMLLTIGAYPYDDPSPVGSVAKEQATSTLVLSLRSTPRAYPLALLGFAVLAGVAVDRFLLWRPRVGQIASVGVVALAALNIWPLWTGGFVGDVEARDENLPEYWTEVAADLDARGDDTRVLMYPGSLFAVHRWGETTDHILPALLDRPVAYRELIMYGSPAGADLVVALDRRFQERVVEPEAIAPISRLLGAGDVLFQLDLQYERYRTARPTELSRLIDQGIPGLGAPVPYGPLGQNVPSPAAPLIDEVTLRGAANPPDHAPVITLSVDDPLPIVRVRSAEAPLIVAGSGEGLVEVAAAGLLDPERIVLYAADLSEAELADALAAGGTVVVTDSNASSARRHKSIRDMVGFVERHDRADAIDDVDDSRFAIFPDAEPRDRSVALQVGATVTASDYGNPFDLHPEDRPVNAFDGQLQTAWRVGGLEDARGDWLRIDYDEPVPAETVTVVQPVTLFRNRSITELRITVNDTDTVDVALDARSLTAPGQIIELPVREVSSVRFEVIETSVGDARYYGEFTNVGFAEVTVGDAAAVRELIATPATPGDGPATFVLSRRRTDPADPIRDDTEIRLSRRIEVAAGGELVVSGTARVSARADDTTIAAALGFSGPRVGASSHLPGSAHQSAVAAFDGDISTAWSTPRGAVRQQWVSIDLPPDLVVDHLDLAFVDDGRHSRPTQLAVTPAGGEPQFVDVPAAGGDGGMRRIDLMPFSATAVMVGIVEVDEVTAVDWFSGQPIGLPVAIAEIAIDGVATSTAPTELDTGCRDDLLTIDGAAVPVQISGSATQAGLGEGLAVEACGPPLVLSAGQHDIETAIGFVTGIDIDRLVLAPVEASGASPAAPASLPTVQVVDEGRDSFELELTDVDGPFWLVLGQGYNEGWQADADGLGDLGDPVLVDGFANGWLVDPGAAERLVVELRWTPQRQVWVALVVSLIAIAACLTLLIRGRSSTVGAAASDAHRDARLVFETTHGPSSWPLSTRALVVGAVVAGVVGTLTISPVLGLLAALALVGASRLRLGRATIGLSMVVLVVVAGGYEVQQQSQMDFPHNGAWPTLFDAVDGLAYAALALLITETILTLAHTLRTRNQ